MLDETRDPLWEVLLRLGVKEKHIPFIISLAERRELKLIGHILSDAKSLVKFLDEVVSSDTEAEDMKTVCLGILRRVSSKNRILPEWYHLPQETSSDDLPQPYGYFADVRKGRLDEDQVRVKVFRATTMEFPVVFERRFHHEVMVWKYVKHPNVVPLLGVSEDMSKISIISPWLKNGNILEYIGEHLDASPLQLLTQAACGLEHLHSLGIVHGGISPGNVLINDEGVACLGDFGIAGVMDDFPHEQQTMRKRGPFRYMAPELLDPSRFGLSNGNPKKESDVYSFVMTGYEVLTGILPHGEVSYYTIYFHVVSGKRPARPEDGRWLPNQIWDMIEACWNERRELRLDMSTVRKKLEAASNPQTTDVPANRQPTMTWPPRLPWEAISRKAAALVRPIFSGLVP